MFNKNIKICDNILKRTIGLMFSKPKIALLVFNKEEKINLHTFFVFFNLDIYFLDKNFKVAEVRKNVKPFNFVYCKKKAKFVLEAPTGLVKFKVGNKVKLFK